MEGWRGGEERERERGEGGEKIFLERAHDKKERNRTPNSRHKTTNMLYLGNNISIYMHFNYFCTLLFFLWVL